MTAALIFLAGFTSGAAAVAFAVGSFALRMDPFSDPFTDPGDWGDQPNFKATK